MSSVWLLSFHLLRRAAAAAALLSGLHAGLAAAHGPAARGDHNAKHDGVVLVHQDIHYETVLLPKGGVQLWITDEMRNDLPAATVSDVAVEIARPGAKPESVDMAMAPSGEYWEGSSAAAIDANTVVRVAFLLRGEPVFVNVPGEMWPALTKSSGAQAHGH